MYWINVAREMALMAALRACLVVFELAGQKLALSEDERRAVIGRVEDALLPGSDRR